MRSPLRPAQATQASASRTGLVASLSALALLLGACSSGPDRDNSLGLTKEEYLGLYFENAVRYVELGDMDRAIGQATKALEIDPENERFLLIFARCHLLRGGKDSIQMAIDVFDNMEKPDDFRVQMSWAAAIERKGVIYDETSDALRAGRRSTDAADPIARADELRAEAEGFWQDAKTKFQRSIELRSGEPEAINGLVRTTALLGEFDESIVWAGELIDAVRASQGLVSQQMDAIDLSANRESKLFRDRRSNRELEISARLHIATLERRMGRLAKSSEQFDAISAVDPDFAEAYSLNAQVLYELGEYRKAKESITRFIQMKARTVKYDDPNVMKAYDLSERCDQALRSGRG